METRLTTKEVAELENKDERTIRRWAKDEIIKAECNYNEFNSPVYLIPVSELTDGAQKKCFRQVKASLPKAAISASKKDNSLDCMVFWNNYKQNSCTDMCHDFVLAVS